VEIVTTILSVVSSVVYVPLAGLELSATNLFCAQLTLVKTVVLATFLAV